MFPFTSPAGSQADIHRRWQEVFVTKEAFFEGDLQISQSLLRGVYSLLCPALAELVFSSGEESVLFLHSTDSLHCSVWETSGHQQYVVSSSVTIPWFAHLPLNVSSVNIR